MEKKTYTVTASDERVEEVALNLYPYHLRIHQNSKKEDAARDAFESAIVFLSVAEEFHLKPSETQEGAPETVEEDESER